ncbi:MAG: sulfatase [Acidobacteriota bacterium]
MVSVPDGPRRGIHRLRAVTAGLSLSCVLACGESPPPRHNVLLVTFDTTRADHLEPYGGPAGLTPALVDLARRGTVFETVRASAAVTPVAHASLFTGLNPYRHGLRTLHGNRLFHLPEKATTLAERYEALGYATAAFISAFPCSRRFGLAQGFATFDEPGDLDRARVGAAGNVSTGLAQRGSLETTNAALAWLTDRPRDRPFFLWIHYFDPHDPLLRPPPVFTSPFVDGVAEHADIDRLLSSDPASFGKTYGNRPEVMRPWLKGIYSAEIHFADGQLARILEELRGTGLLGKTIVAVTADHGEGLGDHGWWGHGILYEEQLRVPLILAGPGVPGAMRVADAVRQIDVAPTLMDLSAKTRFRDPVEGISLVPLVRARASGGRPDPASLPGPAYADSVAIMRYGAFFSRDAVEEKNDQLYAWIEGDMKWIRHRIHPENGELYDLATDPHEAHNLFGERPGEAARLDAHLSREKPMTEAISLTLPEDPEVLQRLRSLGYVE